MAKPCPLTEDSGFFPKAFILVIRPSQTLMSTHPSSVEHMPAAPPPPWFAIFTHPRYERKSLNISRPAASNTFFPPTNPSTPGKTGKPSPWISLSFPATFSLAFGLVIVVAHLVCPGFSALWADHALLLPCPTGTLKLSAPGSLLAESFPIPNRRLASASASSQAL